MEPSIINKIVFTQLAQHAVDSSSGVLTPLTSFQIKMIVGRLEPNTSDIQNCAFIDNRVKRGVFDACAKMIYRQISLISDRDDLAHAMILKYIKGVTARSLNQRYFRRLSSMFPVVAYAFCPTAFVIEITDLRCLEIYREICRLVIADLRTQWPSEDPVARVCSTLENHTVSLNQIFLAAKQSCFEKVQKSADLEGWDLFEPTPHGMLVVWQKFSPQTFNKQNPKKLNGLRKKLIKQKSRLTKERKADEITRATFIPVIDDW